MARNESGVYSLPGTYLAVTGQTITAAQHNTPLQDIAADLNATRPQISGGTGATSLGAATVTPTGYSTAQSLASIASGVLMFDTAAALQAATFTADRPSRVGLRGYLSGQIGAGSTWVAVSSEPSHGAKLQSADERWWALEPWMGAVSVVQLGATGDGSTDDKAAFDRATSLMADGGTRGSDVIVPDGAYKLSNLTIPVNVNLIGSNKATCAILAASATGDFVTLAGVNRVESVTFGVATGVTRTANALVRLNSNCICVRCDFKDYFIGAIIGDKTEVIANIIVGAAFSFCNFFNPRVVSGVRAIVFEFVSNGILDNCIITGAATGTQPQAAVQVLRCDTVVITACNITQHGAALSLVPGTGHSVIAVQCANSLFDSSGTDADAVERSNIEIGPVGGDVKATIIDGCWIGLAADANGIEIAPTSSGRVDDLVISDCLFRGNATHGVSAVGTGGTVRNITVSGCHGHGQVGGAFLRFTAVTKFKLVGNTGGASSDFTTNNIGAQIIGACDKYIIALNDFADDTTAIDETSVTGSPSKIVQDNLT